VADGAGSDTEDAIDDLVERRPDITVTAGNAIGKLVAQVFDFLINAVNGLLLMSVLVALIGIVNTLSLSILERRRELGLLRVVGMTDRRVRRMVRFESVLIAVIGTVTGLVLGLAIAFGIVAAIDRLADADIGFDPSLPRLGIVLALGVVLGLLASLIPSARSTRLEVLDAIEAT
jgi:putative ABC transport system permease protein